MPILPFRQVQVFFTLYFTCPFLQTQETFSLIYQILDVQPRMATSSGGKTSDEIVNELAENVMSKIPDKLDIDTALPELFEVIICMCGLITIH